MKKADSPAAKERVAAGTVTKKQKAGRQVSQKKETVRVKEILDRLDDKYGKEVHTYLNHKNPLQLLIATMLSAQCTDERVNTVTPALFKKYKNAKDFADADIKELEALIHSTGFYHSKAKNIIACCKILKDEYGGEVPGDIDALVKLPGVGRKTANVIRGNIYKEPSIVVDTHVGRISRRLGFTKEKDPVKVEYDLMKVWPKYYWIRGNIQLIALGRNICKAPRPKCAECCLSDLCPSYDKQV